MIEPSCRACGCVRSGDEHRNRQGRLSPFCPECRVNGNFHWHVRDQAAVGRFLATMARKAAPPNIDHAGLWRGRGLAAEYTPLL